MSRIRLAAFAGLLLAGIAGAAVLVVAIQPTQPAASIVISQQDRRFNPDSIEIRTGQVVRIVNDDGDLQHHAYVSSPSFSFDSGEQKPGRHTDILFPVAGTFNVLCGIHPKMRLVVVVK